ERRLFFRRRFGRRSQRPGGGGGDLATGYTNYSGAFLAQSAAYKTRIYASGTATVTAGSSPTRLVGSGKGAVLVGGGADDTFVVSSLKDQFSGGGGGDTVFPTLD